jgi:hypothetical protein
VLGEASSELFDRIFGFGSVVRLRKQRTLSGFWICLYVTNVNGAIRSRQLASAKFHMVKYLGHQNLNWPALVVCHYISCTIPFRAKTKFTIKTEIQCRVFKTKNSCFVIVQLRTVNFLTISFPPCLPSDLYQHVPFITAIRCVIQPTRNGCAVRLCNCCLQNIGHKILASSNVDLGARLSTQTGSRW